MNILILGANGFIARHIVAKLAAEHHIMAAVRKQSLLLSHIENVQQIEINFLKFTTPQHWLSLLDNIDVVINCIGVFNTRDSKTMWDIHYHVPKQLYMACITAAVSKIIHLSALGIDHGKNPYARSKLAIEQQLSKLAIDHVIIRPSMVYGSGSYGGTSLFRVLAAMPGVILLPGAGQQLLQPIHMDDVTIIINKSLILSGHHLIFATGDEQLSLRRILIILRQWMGFPNVATLAIPISLIKLMALVGNHIHNAPLSSTAVEMINTDNIATEAQRNNLISTIGYMPIGFSKKLQSMISSVQDRWHARIAIVRPLLIFSIALLWIISGAASLLNYKQSLHLLTQAHLQGFSAATIIVSASVLDIVLGLATLIRFHIKLIGSIQIVLIVIYTCILSFTIPTLWLDPFASIAKNIPLLCATLIMIILQDIR